MVLQLRNATLLCIIMECLEPNLTPALLLLLPGCVCGAGAARCHSAGAQPAQDGGGAGCHTQAGGLRSSGNDSLSSGIFTPRCPSCTHSLKRFCHIQRVLHADVLWHTSPCIALSACRKYPFFSIITSALEKSLQYNIMFASAGV